MLRGVNPEKLAENMTNKSMVMKSTIDVGILGSEGRHRKPDKQQTSMITPESMGIPADEAYQFLTLIRRYLLHGPSLGFQQTQTGQSSAGGGLVTAASGTSSVLSSLVSRVA